MRQILALLVAASFFAVPVLGQLPLPALKQKQGNLARLPNDQVEGTIFEYKATPKKKSKNPDDPTELEGKFRIEGKALFDVSRTVDLPSKGEVKKKFESIRKGKRPSIKLPAPPQQKRIGQFRKLRSGKYRLDFDDKESLYGIMIMGKKPGTSDVWIGTFSQKEGKRTVREWIVNLRPIED